MKRIVLLLSLLALTIAGSSAQKYGYLNLGNLLAMMPVTKAADTELETYQKQLVAKGEEMANTFKKDYNEFLKSVQEGSLSPVQQEEGQSKLKIAQQEIQAYEQEVVQKIQTKRQELLKPIIEKVETAIKEVGKEQGYLLIFDTSIFNAVLFTRESDDLMPLVKAKLGIEN